MTSPSSPCNGLASVLAALALGLSISAMALTAPASAEQADPLLGKGVEVTALNSVQMNDVQGTGYCPYNDCGRAGIEEAYEAYKAGYEAYYNYRGTSEQGRLLLWQGQKTTPLQSVQVFRR